MPPTLSSPRHDEIQQNGNNKDDSDNQRGRHDSFLSGSMLIQSTGRTLLTSFPAGLTFTGCAPSTFTGRTLILTRPAFLPSEILSPECVGVTSKTTMVLIPLSNTVYPRCF
jgi:hypothetical protein